MKQITASGVKLGPYQTVVVDGDRYIVNGAAVVPFAALPNGHQVEDWVQPPVDLSPFKAAKNTEINDARMTANRGTFTHAGKVFSCDELSRSDIDGVNGYAALIGDLPPGWPGAWKAADNSYHPIADIPAWGAFYAAMVATGNANFAKSQALKAQLAAATTVEQINAIQW